MYLKQSGSLIYIYIRIHMIIYAFIFIYTFKHSYMCTCIYILLYFDMYIEVHVICVWYFAFGYSATLQSLIFFANLHIKSHRVVISASRHVHVPLALRCSIGSAPVATSGLEADRRILESGCDDAKI